MVGCVGESKRYKRTVERKFTAWASNINNFSSSTVVNGSINNTRYSVLYDSSFSFKAHATFMDHAHCHYRQNDWLFTDITKDINTALIIGARNQLPLRRLTMRSPVINCIAYTTGSLGNGWLFPF